MYKRASPKPKHARRKLSVFGIKKSAIDGISKRKENNQFFKSNHVESPFKRSAGLSKVGRISGNPSKANQDRILQFTGDSNMAMFAVFDGHGQKGEVVAQYLTDYFPAALAKLNFDADPEDLEKQAEKLFRKVDKKLNKAVDCQLSENPPGKKVITMNVGDSRAIIVSKNPKALSTDQKPSDIAEKERILRCNGRVEPWTDSDGSTVGPDRVWLRDYNIPGLAMSRSFGDKMAHSVGVIVFCFMNCKATPVITYHTLGESDMHIVLGSDGIFEFLQNKEIQDIVLDQASPFDACKEIVLQSQKKWIQEESVIDDCSVIVVELNS